MFRQLFDAETSTYTYLLADENTHEAILIDSVREQVERDLKLIAELGLKLVYVLDTHTHADHITAAGEIRARTGARTVASRNAAPCADLHLSHGDTLKWGSLELRVLETPGHTDDSISFYIDGKIFTGDALLIRAVGRTDFQNGSAPALYESLTKVLFALPDETLVYPAHDYKGMTVSTIAEEKSWNARVAHRSCDEFVQVMGSLHLPPPKQINVAVPANRACGVVAAPRQG
jgi:glyoxylase-like metal-dependent hydrolase (beta-lactamase superfamily II)